MSFIQPIIRQLLRAPGFAVLVVGFLGVSLAALLALVTAAHALLLKPLPFPGGDRLVEARGYSSRMGFGLGYSAPLALELEAMPEIEALGLMRRAPGFEDSHGKELSAVSVDNGLIRLLGVRALIGRLPSPDEPQDSVLLSESFWRQHLGGDVAVLDRPLELPGRRLNVIGVVPDSHAFPRRDTALWLPLKLDADARSVAQIGNWSDLRVYARLAPDIAPDSLAAALNGRYAGLPELDEMRDFMGLEVRVTPLRDLWVGERAGLLGLLMLAALLVLLTLAANLASLWIGRALARQKELAMRSALGATTWQALAPLLGEIALLTSAGVLLGLALTVPALDVLAVLGLVDAGAALPVSFGATTLFAAVLAGVLLFAGLALGPLWLARRGLSAQRLAAGGRSLSPGVGGARARRALVTLQVGVAVSLLVAGGLLLRSLASLLDVDQGFDEQGFVMAEVAPKHAQIVGDDTSAAQRVAAWYTSAAQLPGVQMASFSTSPPYSRAEAVSAFRVNQDGGDASARDRFVGPDYFRLIGQPLLAGRGFVMADAGAEAVIVDEVFVRQHLSGSEPLGAVIGVYQGETEGYRNARVVGVVGAVKHNAPDESIEMGAVYRLLRTPADSNRLGRFAMLQMQGGFDGLAERLDELAQANGLRLVKAAVMSDWIRLSLADRMPLLYLLLGFSVTCLLLCCTGLFALVQFSVGSRRAEFGLRLALGSSEQRLSRDVVFGALRSIVPGLALGLAGALTVGHLLSARLFQVQPFDPLTIGVVVLALLGSTLLASWLPARSAASVSPALVLRQD